MKRKQTGPSKGMQRWLGYMNELLRLKREFDKDRAPVAERPNHQVKQ